MPSSIGIGIIFDTFGYMGRFQRLIEIISIYYALSWLGIENDTFGNSISQSILGIENDTQD